MAKYECPLKKSARKTQRDLEKGFKDFEKKVEKGTKDLGKEMAKFGIGIIDALPRADLVQLPSKEDIAHAFDKIKNALNYGSDVLIDGIFDAMKDIARIVAPGTDLGELDRARNDAKHFIHRTVDIFLNVVGNEIKLIAGIAEKIQQAYKLAKEHKWEEAAKTLSEALADLIVVMIPAHVRQQIQILRDNIKAVVAYLKQAVYYLGVAAKEMYKYSPITQLVIAIDKKAGDQMVDAINDGVDGAVRGANSTVDSFGAAVKAADDLVEALKKGDWEAAAKSAVSLVMNTAIVAGTVCGGISMTLLAGAAGGIASKRTSSSNANWIEFGLGFASPSGLGKTATKTAAKGGANLGKNADNASDKTDDFVPKSDLPSNVKNGGDDVEVGTPEGSRSGDIAYKGDEVGTKGKNPDANKSNKTTPNGGGHVNGQVYLPSPASAPKVNKSAEVSVGNKPKDLVDDVELPNAGKPDGANLAAANKMKKIKLDAQRKSDEADAKKKKDAEKEKDNNDPSDALDLAVSLGSMGLVGASAAADAAAVAAAAVQAAQHTATMLALAKIVEEAATQAAILKLSTDLHDSNLSFMKGIGASLKAAAQ